MARMQLVVALLTCVYTACSLEAIEASWRGVLRDPVLSRFMDQLSFNTAPVDMSVSRSCLSKYTGIHEDIYKFAKRLGSTSRIFTIRLRFCHLMGNCEGRNGPISKALMLFCGQHWLQISNALAQQYSHHVFVFSDDFYVNKGQSSHALRWRNVISSALEHGGFYNISFHENHTVLTMGSQTECLSCENSALWAGVPLRVTRQMPLEGQELRVHCLRPYICERPTFPVLVDALWHRKANVTTFQVDQDSENKPHLAEAFLMSSVNAVVYNPTPEVRTAIRIPEVIIPAYYDSFSYSVFAKRRHPLPRQAVLVLPFTRRVWSTLIVAMGLCVAAMKLVERFRTRGKARCAGSCIHHTFVALLLHQSCRIPRVQHDSTPARLIIGPWALLVVVMSTAFKASLTSLLRDVPLEGRPLKFTTLDDIGAQRYSHCRLTYAGDGVRFSYPDFTPVKRKRPFCISPDKKVLYMSFSRIVYLMHVPSIRTHEVYIKQLYQHDYAPLPQEVSPYLSGPSIRSNSRYRDAVSWTIVQTFESGLFQRQMSLQEYKNLWAAAHKENITRSKIAALSFGDLKEFMYLFIYGSGVATLCLIAEVALRIVDSFSASFKGRHDSRLLFYKRTKSRKLKQRRFTFELQEIDLTDFWREK